MVVEQAAEQRPSPLLVIVPGCRVVIDRRLAERRRVERARAAEERRGGDRRSGRLEDSRGLVVLVR